MELKDIVAIAGQGGLHHIKGRSKNGLIVETIGTGRRFSTSFQDKVSVLEDISVFTQADDMRLAHVFLKLREIENVPGPKDDMKSNREFLVQHIQLDSERVYDNDIRKLLAWYHQLKDVLDFEKLGKEDENPEGETPADATETHAEPKVRKQPQHIANKVPKANTKAASSNTSYRPKAV